ncbi:MAG: hypothetical protein HN474_08540 [Nitrospina sp.]|nr:hypothetical protein [Nitrospina sp.]
MKKYLFGLGAMLVGAGLMFVLMHGEVSAVELFDDLLQVDKKVGKKGILTNDADCEIFNLKFGLAEYCKIKDLTCVTSGESVSCVKSGGLFK